MLSICQSTKCELGGFFVGVWRGGRSHFGVEHRHLEPTHLHFRGQWQPQAARLHLAGQGESERRNQREGVLCVLYVLCVLCVCCVCVLCVLCVCVCVCVCVV